MPSPTIIDQGDIVAAAVDAISAVLKQALKTRGRASLMVSGGSSPRPLYERLSKVKLDWKNVTISLVDERWVDPGQSGSNEDFIRNYLVQNEAKQANFFGLKTKHESVQAGLTESELRFANTKTPFDICIMGMGSDAHTASWFPNSQGMEEALSPTNKNVLCAINAKGAPVAGDYPHRISLTLNSVLESHLIILFIPGETKRRVFEAALEKSPFEAPVQALQNAGSKLHVFGSPSQ